MSSKYIIIKSDKTMKDIMALIRLFANDYQEAKSDMKKNDPQVKWLFIAVVVLFFIAGWIQML